LLTLLAPSSSTHHHGHGVDDHHHDEHSAHAHDLNLRSAYVHVVADAATSVLAITALTGGLFLGWAWLDPAMGIVGAAVVAVWAWGLIRQTSKVLLDSEMDHPVVREIAKLWNRRGLRMDHELQTSMSGGWGSNRLPPR
jgi:Co/Zn/Cd efflux system component